ncbi:MAG: primosomal replication protein [Gammaproteobacteria bacterium]|nr:primosomal replication protein [Gammaproteobacteria bacterium]
MHTDDNLRNALHMLEQEAKHLPKNISKTWFSPELFHCRSERSCDYLQEIQANLQKLAELNPSSESASWLGQHVNAQLNAFTQAVFRAKRPAPAVTSKQKLPSDERQSRSQRLYAELAKHHEYERRLSDNLRQAQAAASSASSSESHQRQVLLCQQRLMRCQKAIANIEAQIERQTPKY